jgi:hypothetical protein
VAEILFEWDEANVEHIARHGYDPDEVEEVFEGKFKIRKGRESAYICYGSTLDGRLAFIVFKRFGGGRIRRHHGARYGRQRAAHVPEKITYEGNESSEGMAEPS